MARLTRRYSIVTSSSDVRREGGCWIMGVIHRVKCKVVLCIVCVLRFAHEIQA
jgi:hypothetical protein